MSVICSKDVLFLWTFFQIENGDFSLPNILQLIPDSFTNNFEGKEFTFNCDYVGQFCNQVKKLSSNKGITFNGNNPNTPFIISAKWDIKNPFEDLEGFEAKLNYLIMPIVNLDRNKK